MARRHHARTSALRLRLLLAAQGRLLRHSSVASSDLRFEASEEPIDCRVRRRMKPLLLRTRLGVREVQQVPARKYLENEARAPQVHQMLHLPSDPGVVRVQLAKGLCAEGLRKAYARQGRRDAPVHEAFAETRLTLGTRAKYEI